MTSHAETFVHERSQRGFDGSVEGALHRYRKLKVVGSNSVQSLKMLSGFFFSSVMASFASIIISILFV